MSCLCYVINMLITCYVYVMFFSMFYVMLCYITCYVYVMLYNMLCNITFMFHKILGYVI